mmetsp:Transcript_97753/g.191950  ORF Transcript_97753/g.191950 Transcript_97753/m.191950 type:complete len:162 (+) Transcript_97753:3-488(+)
MVDDPTSRKPEDWDDEQRIPDPEAEQPDEWDEEEDGVWEVPMIDNPGYRGFWFPEQVENPAYNGTWMPRQLENPEYVEEVYPIDDIGAVGFELWTVNKGSVFDNVLICTSFAHARAVGRKLLEVFAKEGEAKKAWQKSTGKFSDRDEELDVEDGDLPRDEL